jgi:hypothetical protein
MRIKIKAARSIPTSEKLYQYGLKTPNEVGTIPPFKKNEK